MGWYVNKTVDVAGASAVVQSYSKRPLTHLDLVLHICVSKLTIIGSDNGLSPGRRQAIIWTNAGILNVNEV